MVSTSWVCLYQIQVSMTSGVKTSPRSRNSWSALQGFERGFQRARGGRYGVELFGLKVVDVLIERLAGPQLVLDPVEDGHEHGREQQVGIGGSCRARGIRSGGFWGWGC